ncbi:head-tail connector protein [Andreprevotia chitinilytica]|uniref:head-tail connector protein n=1 Tax=Andreprevotia chitinilytica TaxID=396808 RepID=UPI00054D551B|nr:head-tail connector protein [Andreprevotia chitinilytica]
MLECLTPASEALLTLAEARLQCRIDDDDKVQDTLLQILIAAALTQAEAITDRPLLPQTWGYSAEAFPAGDIRLKPDVTAVASVRYTDAAGNAQILPSTAYRIVERRFLRPTTGWPDGTQAAVEFDCGCFTAATLSPALKAWAQVFVATLFANREAINPGVLTELPRTYVDGLLDYLRLGEVG